MHYLPQPYPDEILGSILTRAGRHTGLSFASVLSTLSKEVGYQRALNHCAALLGLAGKLGVPAGCLLESHTVFPYAACFLPSELRKSYASWVLKANNSSYTQLSHFAKFAPRPWVKRFCIQCAYEDSREFGEAYWHRKHCLPAMTHCPIHRSPLIACNLGKSASNALMLPSDVTVTTVPVPPRSALANIVMQLSLDALNRNLVQLDYRSALKELGYAVPLSLAESTDFSQAVLGAAKGALLHDTAWEGSMRPSGLWPAHLVLGRPASFPAPKHLLVHAYIGHAGTGR